MPFWAKRDINSVQNRIYKIYSRKSTHLTVVALSCKTTGKTELTKSAAMGLFVMLQAVYTTAEKVFRTIAVL